MALAITFPEPQEHQPGTKRVVYRLHLLGGSESHLCVGKTVSRGALQHRPTSSPLTDSRKYPKGRGLHRQNDRFSCAGFKSNENRPRVHGKTVQSTPLGAGFKTFDEEIRVGGQCCKESNEHLRTAADPRIVRRSFPALSIRVISHPDGTTKVPVGS